MEIRMFHLHVNSLCIKLRKGNINCTKENNHEEMYSIILRKFSNKIRKSFEM